MTVLELFPAAPEIPVARVLSYGGGLDSFAALLDAIARGEKPDVAAFCDVADPAGEDPGEWPSTYQHVREVVLPLCAREGIEFVWIDADRFPVRDARSLFAWLKARGQIPVAGPNRICTTVAKVERFEAWMDSRWPGQLVEVWVGFEAGEESRAEKDPNAGKARRPRPDRARRRNRFPLMERGLCRCRCEALVRALGHPVPRKSACLMCPYASKGDWQRLARELPHRFSQVTELEADKPPTKRGRKLSIMGFRSFEKRPAPKKTRLRILHDNDGIAYSAPTLPEFIRGEYQRTQEPCAVCGAAQRATKLTGCDYLAA